MGLDITNLNNSIVLNNCKFDSPYEKEVHFKFILWNIAYFSNVQVF